jgi:hypothetical protein
LGELVLLEFWDSRRNLIAMAVAIPSDGFLYVLVPLGFGGSPFGFGLLVEALKTSSGLKTESKKLGGFSSSSRHGGSIVFQHLD